MPRVAHVITTLDVGGAERLLADVIAHGSDAVLVVNLSPPGTVSDVIRDMGVEVVDLGLRRLTDLPRAVRRLTAELRRAAPDVVQTWMYHADLLGGFAARRAGGPALAWSLHASDLPRGEVRRRTLLLRRLAARLSHRWPDAVVCTSQATREVHEQLGYDPTRMLVIHNGFRIPDPDPDAGRALREELGIPADHLVVVRVGRLDPQKDWPTFVAAMRPLLEQRPDLHVVGCGRDVVAAEPELGGLQVEAIRDRVHLLGLRHDVAAIHAAADVAVSSSAFGETFPLAIGEAMAAGVPVVATDIGDCRELVSDGGTVVPPSDIAAVSSAVEALLHDDQRRCLGACARKHVAQCFDIEAVVDRYHELHRRLAGSDEC